MEHGDLPKNGEGTRNRRPTRGRAVLAAVPFGIAMGAMNGIGQGNWISGLVSGIVAAAIFAVLLVGVIGPSLDRMHRAVRAEGASLTDLSGSQKRRAQRAVNRGPVPNDDRVRRAAVGLAKHQLVEIRRARRLFNWTWPILTILFAAVAVIVTPWFAIAVVLTVGLWWFTRTQPARLQQRIALLGDPPARAAER